MSYSLVLAPTNHPIEQGIVIAGKVEVFGKKITIGFQEDHKSHELLDIEHVNIEVLGFSCNYRDRAILCELFASSFEFPICFGSDFVGRIVAIGDNVSGLQVGDLVINNNSYPDSGCVRVRPGVPTNGASSGLVSLHQSKVKVVPSEMPLAVAASFSIAAQTCKSMIRKAKISYGDRCIVTAGTSATSNFLLGELKRLRAEIYVVTSGQHDFGADVKGVIRVSHPIGPSLTNNPIFDHINNSLIQVKVVFDCLSDLYSPHILPLLGMSGKYITCGTYGQGGVDTYYHPDSATWRKFIIGLITKNVNFHGNCLGEERDLDDAIRDRECWDLVKPTDIYGRGQASDFVLQSFEGRSQDKKPVYLRDDSS